MTGNAICPTASCMDHSAFRTKGASHWRSLPVPFYLGLQSGSFLLPGQSLYFSLSFPLQYAPGWPVINVLRTQAWKPLLCLTSSLCSGPYWTLLFLSLLGSMTLTRYLPISPSEPPTGTTTRDSICQGYLHSTGLWSSVTHCLASVPNTEGERIPPITPLCISFKLVMFLRCQWTLVLRLLIMMYCLKDLVLRPHFDFYRRGFSEPNSTT